MRVIKVVIAPDSFKGSLSAPLVVRAMARGVKRAGAGIETVEIPLADGGEGTVEALVAATEGRLVKAEVSDPLGRRVEAAYGFLGGRETAVIEMAAASGLGLLASEELDPMKVSTFGTGELILDAVGSGAREMIIGIGGSATVDGGTGMARALGFVFFDGSGKRLEGGGEILPKIARIDASKRAGGLEGLEVTVACDVTNPLTGPEGAACVYGPQKGATPQEVKLLDAGLFNLAEVIRRDLGVDVEGLAGGGAAGGLGAGLVGFLGGELKSGIDIVLEAVDLSGRIEGADVVFTGEGRVDAQSSFGKVAAGVARAAREKRVPVILLAGEVADGAREMLGIGVSAIFSIAKGPSTEEAMKRNAAALLENAAEQALGAFLSGARRGIDGRSVVEGLGLGQAG